MLFRRVTRIGLAALLITLAIIPLQSALAVIGTGPFTDAVAYCDHGTFELAAIVEDPPPVAPQLIPMDPQYKVEVWDNGTLIGSTTFIWSLGDMYYSGEVPFDQQPTGETVLFKLYVWNYLPEPSAPDFIIAEEDWMLRGQITAPVECDLEGPGCDTRIAMTDNAVVGLFVADALTYWGPDAGKGTTVTIAAGNTAWVLGMDASGAYYKIVWVCDCLWVPVGTMGPNPDAVWNSTPLPMTVVE